MGRIASGFNLLILENKASCSFHKRFNGYQRRRSSTVAAQVKSQKQAFWLRLSAIATLSTGMLLVPIGNPAGLVSVAQSLQDEPVWISTEATSVMPERQGTRVFLNGRTWVAHWSQVDERLGIADLDLVDMMGIELLDSSTYDSQPVQWFSDSALELPTWFTSQQRYLDITDLIYQAGWQAQVNGTTLILSTPEVQVLDARYGTQAGGDRLVIDLDQSAPVQVTQTGSTVTVTIDAEASSSLTQIANLPANSRFGRPTLASSNGRFTLSFTVPSGNQYHVSTLTETDRVVIDVAPNLDRTQDIQWAPGLRWQETSVVVGSRRFPVEVLEVDLTQPEIRLAPIWGDASKMVGTYALLSMAQPQGAIAAINGGFFNRDNLLPLGAIRRDGTWFSGPILNRGAIAWDENGQVLIGKLSLQEAITLDTGVQFPVLFLNSGYVQAGLSRYTSAWGTTYTPLIDNEILMVVEDNQVTQTYYAGQAGSGSYPIPEDGYLLTARAYATAANQILASSAVVLSTATNPSTFDAYPNILGAGPVLLQNRQIVLNAVGEQFSEAFSQQAAVRSAIATTDTGKVLFVTAQASAQGSGPTLREFAQVMQQLDAVNALNLDGGSSSTLILGDRILNRPASSVARVHNGLAVFLSPPGLEQSF
jgi:hypothetical protein